MSSNTLQRMIDGALLYHEGLNFGGDDDYFRVDQDGFVSLVGEATTWDDLRIVPGAFDFPGNADPALADWQPGGSGTTFSVYECAASDEAFFSVQVPHQYKEGSDFLAHVHWTPGDRGTAESGKTVAWKIDYTIANIDGTFGASATLDLTDTCTGANDAHLATPEITIDGSSTTISAMIMGRIYRDTGDTWATNTGGNCPILLEIDFHYQIDGFGSDETYPK